MEAATTTVMTQMEITHASVMMTTNLTVMDILGGIKDWVQGFWGYIMAV